MPILALLHIHISFEIIITFTILSFNSLNQIISLSQSVYLFHRKFPLSSLQINFILFVEDTVPASFMKMLMGATSSRSCCDNLQNIVHNFFTHLDTKEKVDTVEKEDLLAIKDNFTEELDDVKEQLATMLQSKEQLTTMRQTMEQLATMKQTMEQLATITMKQTMEQLATMNRTMEQLATMKQTIEQLATMKPAMEQLATMKQTMEQLPTMKQTMEQLTAILEDIKQSKCVAAD